MSIHVEGFKPPDEKWKKMKAVYDSCKAAGLEVPQQVLRYFEYEVPDPAGVKVDLKKYVQDFNRESREGFELKVGDLPADVKVIRFFVAY